MLFKTTAFAALVTLAAASTGSAAPFGAFAPAAATRPLATPVQYFYPYGYGYGYGYGPRRFGYYGFRRLRRPLPNGTGYHGRGTLTGGPVGGLPNRN